MKLRPLHDRVVVKRLDNERTTASGIVIPDNAAEKPDQGGFHLSGQPKADAGRDDRHRGRLYRHCLYGDVPGALFPAKWPSASGDISSSNIVRSSQWEPKQPEPTLSSSSAPVIESHS